MNTKHFSSALALVALAGVLASGTASAQTDESSTEQHRLGEHPAVLVKRQAPGVGLRADVPGLLAGLAKVERRADRQKRCRTVCDFLRMVAIPL